MITTADIAVALGRTTPDAGSTDALQWEMWINQALFLLRFGDGEHVGLGDLAALDQEALDYVVLQAVVAHAKRPDAARQVTVSVDDASTSRTFETSEGFVAIVNRWWDMLSPSVNNSGAFSVRPGFVADGPCW